MANDAFFHQLEKKPYFINASRERCTGAVIRALEQGRRWERPWTYLEQLDYSEEEKLQLQVLLSMPNALVTPHIAGYSHEAFANGQGAPGQVVYLSGCNTMVSLK